MTKHAGNGVLGHGSGQNYRRIVRLVASTILLVVVCGHGFAQDSEGPTTSWLTKPDFWIATAANLAGVGLFVARVHAPAAAPILGYATQAIGIPALAFGIRDAVRGEFSATTAGLFTYAAWAFGAAVVDHVFQLNYRDPVNLAVLVPYVVAYYVGIGVLSATQLDNGVAPWVIAGSTCILAVGASFYARAMGAD